MAAKLLAITSLSASANTYFYTLASRSDQSTVAVIASDDTLRLFNASTLAPTQSFSSCHAGVSCLSTRKQQQADLVTAGRDGLVKLWDTRAKSAVLQCADVKRRPLSAATTQGEHLVAAGTDSDKEGLGDVSVLVFDVRKPNAPVRNYAESHTDAITQLSFHPTQKELLLSASTDGLVSFFNVEHEDEDDALQRVLNPRSAVHCAGFLSAEQAYVLTTDEHFLIYPLADKEGDENDKPLDFGDVRSTLDCMYVVNLVQQSGQVPLVAYGHNELRKLSLVELQDGPHAWKFGRKITFPDAHGEEVVRDVLLVPNSRSVLTCGEDGHVRAWQLPSIKSPAIDSMDVDTPKSSRKNRDKKDRRFAPY